MGYIKESEIDRQNIIIAEAPFTLDKYDMYYVKFKMKDGSTSVVRTFCEKGTFPKFSSDEFKRLQALYGNNRNLLSDFFPKRLIGENGLMKRQGIDDFIYLGGDLLKNGHIATRNMIQANGKTGQQNFDEARFGLQLQVRSKEKPQPVTNNVKKGKTYVVADIHGMYGSYMEIMKKLKPEDHLIIIGDVIDRGKGGILILQDIMQRKQNRQSNPEITFMIGNHEMQFLETVSIMRRKGLTKQDLITIINRMGARSEYGFYSLQTDPRYKKEKEEWKRKFDLYEPDFQKIIHEKGLTDWEINYMDIWLRHNRGSSTIFDYLLGGRIKDAKEQNAIYSFLLDSYVALPQSINGKDYLFVHAVPPKDPQMIRQMKQSKKGYKLTDLTRDQYVFMVETRDDSTYEQAKAYGFTTICGHSPEFGEIVKDDNKGFVRIDAGCGHNQRESKLALYCIDDGKVEYVEEQEFYQKTPTF